MFRATIRLSILLILAACPFRPDGARAAEATSAEGLPPLAGSAVVEGYLVDGLTREPVVAARVTAEGASALTDHSGHYVLRDLVPGRVVLEAETPGYYRLTRTATVLTGTNGYNLEMLPIPEVAEVFGTAYDLSTMRPLARVRIELDAGTVVTGESGQFRFFKVRRGPRTVRAYCRGYKGHTQDLLVDRDPLQCDIRMSPAMGYASVRGILVSRGDHRPVEGGIAEIDGRRAVSDARGCFSLDGLIAGSTFVTVTGPGYHRLHAKVELPEGPNQVRIVITRIPPLGQVVSVDPRLLEAATADTASARARAQASVPATETDPEAGSEPEPAVETSHDRGNHHELANNAKAENSLLEERKRVRQAAGQSDATDRISGEVLDPATRRVIFRINFLVDRQNGELLEVHSRRIPGPAPAGLDGSVRYKLIRGVASVRRVWLGFGNRFEAEAGVVHSGGIARFEAFLKPSIAECTPPQARTSVLALPRRSTPAPAPVLSPARSRAGNESSGHGDYDASLRALLSKP